MGDWEDEVYHLYGDDEYERQEDDNLGVEHLPAWMTEPCEKHELIGCSLCKPAPPKPDGPAFQRGTTRYDGDKEGAFPARFNSTCPACDNSIYENDMIKRNHRNEFVHQECAQ
jgi:hypothetical protein